MVKFRYIISILAFANLCACSDDSEIFTTPETPIISNDSANVAYTTLTASILGGNTRTDYIDDTDAGVLRVKWNGSEKIMVYSEDYKDGVEFSCNGQVTKDGKTAVFSAPNVILSGKCIAVYPSTAAKDGSFALENQIQKYNDNTEHLSNLDVMKCEFDGSIAEINFEHQIAIMKVDLQVSQSAQNKGVKYVSIKGAWNNKEYKVSFRSAATIDNKHLAKNREVIAYIAVPSGQITNTSLVCDLGFVDNEVHTFSSPIIEQMHYSIGQMYTANYYRIAPCVSKIGQIIDNGHEYVDLGLPSGTMWATSNIGSTESSRYGTSYKWGYTGNPDLDYSGLSLYASSDYCIAGTEYDAATYEWGGSWRTPTLEQFQELLDNTISNDGYSAQPTLTSKINGKSIHFDNANQYNFYYMTSTWAKIWYKPTGYFPTMMHSEKEEAAIRPVICGVTASQVIKTFRDRFADILIKSKEDATIEDEARVKEAINVFESLQPETQAKLGFEKQKLDELMSAINYFKPTFDNEHEYVDLGLPSGTKWATCNIGAENPEEMGGLYAWGEVSTKSDYSWNNYLSRNMTSNADCGTGKDPLKVYVYPNFGSIASTDYDVAHKLWGGSWTMPTFAQIVELYSPSNTKSEFTAVNGTIGRKITSLKNDKSIFIPCAGYYDGATPAYVNYNGYYWSSQGYTAGAGNAFVLCLTPMGIDQGNFERYKGCSIRAVTK